ncbi:MAG TPA: TetR/AcrR family transcriptional regulator [Acidimicrobiales bacterium]|nr:TetR/AcrR family transcriptional regulator [Acidimicrobiales bacterium]
MGPSGFRIACPPSPGPPGRDRCPGVSGSGRPVRRHPAMKAEARAVMARDAGRRERLVDACVRIVGEDGYRRARIADICWVADIPSWTFYACFESKRACFEAAVASIGSGLLRQAGQAFEQAPGSWEDRIWAGLEQLAATLADDATLAAFFAAALDAVTMEAPVVAALVDGAEQAFARPDHRQGVPVPELRLVLAGAVLRPMADYVRDGRGTRLAELVPAVAYCVAAFVVGVERADALVRRHLPAPRSPLPPHPATGREPICP